MTGRAMRTRCLLVIGVCGTSFYLTVNMLIGFTHGSRVKVHVVSRDEVTSTLRGLDRIPAYIQRVVQEGDADFAGQYWAPQHPYQWQHGAPDFDINAEGLRIYEAHVGMAQEAERVGTFAEFTQNILPRIVDLGYNAVQLMAVMEHPYYASFGYHVRQLFRCFKSFRDTGGTQGAH